MKEAVRQAGCVSMETARGPRAVLIEGAPGSGKSSLALALIDRGAGLLGDDGVTLRLDDGLLWAHAPPNIAGRIEIRNVGIAELPISHPAPVALCLRLDPAAPRYLEEATKIDILGIEVPLVALWPDSPILPLRAEWALRLHGRI